MTEDPRAALARRVETIEEAYEFMLAYAAQGREGEDDADAGPGIRGLLERMDAALEGLGADAAACAGGGRGAAPDGWRAFLGILDRDARHAQAAVRLVLAQSSIGSQLVDNLNASIHVRTLLTDLFLIDEALKAKGAG